MVRPATAQDLAAVTALYNRFVAETAVNFDAEPFTPARRREWFSQFGATGRYRIFAGFWDGGFAGYAASMRHKVKRGYDTTVETTIYVDPDFAGRGVGTALYEALIGSLAGEDIRSMVAGVALPNEASIRLHAMFGFEEVGTFHAVGRKFGRFHDVMWLERLV